LLFAASGGASEAALDFGVLAKLAGNRDVTDADLRWDLAGAVLGGIGNEADAAVDSLQNARAAAKEAGDFGKATRILEGPLHYVRLLRDIDWWVDESVSIANAADDFYDEVKRHLRDLTDLPWIGPVGPTPILRHDGEWLPLQGISTVISPLPNGEPPTMAAVSSAVTAAGQGSGG
jgi:hypothetical protein